MNLIGRPSQRYGIPFPVVARDRRSASMGANLAAVVRGIVGIVWYGVQTYFASKAVQVLVLTLIPPRPSLTHGGYLGLSTLGWFSFLFMWFFQLRDLPQRHGDASASSSISAGRSSTS